MQKAVEPIKFMTLSMFGTPRNILLGAGLYYAVEERKEYLHIPIVITFPSVYAGYHLYKHRDDAAIWIKKLRRWSWN
jgi:hypothetical protein